MLHPFATLDLIGLWEQLGYTNDILYTNINKYQ